jgi:hypothetical protein
MKRGHSKATMFSFSADQSLTTVTGEDESWKNSNLYKIYLTAAVVGVISGPSCFAFRFCLLAQLPCPNSIPC